MLEIKSQHLTWGGPLEITIDVIIWYATYTY